MITLGGIQVLDGWLRIPAEGCASGMVELPAAPRPGPSLLKDAAGNAVTVYPVGAIYAGRWRGSLVGSDVLSRTIGASQFRSASVSVVLAAICSGAGLVPSKLLRPDVSGLPLAHWQRAAGTVGGALRDLASRAGVKFRILRDGSVWLGSGLPVPRSPGWRLPTVLDYSQGLRLVTVDGGQLTIDPGDTVEGLRVSAVRYSLGSERVTEVWLDD